MEGIKKIAVFHPEGNINNNPNLSAFCILLTKSGYKIDVWSIVNKNNRNQLPPDHNINLFLLPSYTDFEIIISDYTLAIGVDNGIVQAALVSQILKIPYGFINYELFFDNELISRADKLTKLKQKEACKDISFAIIQDKLRASLLTKEYGISNEKILFMPVAGTGLIPFQRSFFLHDHLSLSKDIKILLQIGSSAQWTMTDWTVKNADSLPDGWAIVIHDISNRNEIKVSHPKVFRTNLNALPIDEMHKLLHSAQCTLALYKEIDGSAYTGKNIGNIGLASGKISTSLQYGIPVLVNSIGEIADLVATYNAGQVIDTSSNEPYACLRKLDSFNNINQNCHKLFNEKLDIQIFVKDIFTIINSIAEKQDDVSVDYDFYLELPQKILLNFDALTLKQQLTGVLKMLVMVTKRALYKTLKKSL